MWHARIVKTRSLAQALVTAGHVRLNRAKLIKPGHHVTPGDVLTIALNSRVLVLKLAATAKRRGPASAARLLYEELAMPRSDGVLTQKEDASKPGTC